MPKFKGVTGYQYDDSSYEFKTSSFSARDEEEAKEKLKSRAKLSEKMKVCKFAVPVSVEKED